MIYKVFLWSLLALFWFGIWWFEASIGLGLLATPAFFLVIVSEIVEQERQTKP